MNGKLTQAEIDNYFHIMGEKVEIKNRFMPDVYTRYNVKRGLRNADGTGVLVGLTEIGDVHAYIYDEYEKIPVEGRLLYRGIDIYDFCDGFLQDNRFGFEECVYLLINGELPDKRELEQFTEIMGAHRNIPEDFVRSNILNTPSHDIMNKLARLVLVMYSYDIDADNTSIPNLLRQSINLISKFPIMAAYGYQAKAHYLEGKSLYIHKPSPELSTSQNLLKLLRPTGEYSELEAKVLDLALVLHAEHGGGNNSTFTTHVVTSTGTDTYSAMAAALCSLKGPRHGGANIKVVEMLEDIKKNVRDWEDDEEIANYLNKILNKEAFDRSGLIYGIGHAVYSISDPRAEIFKGYVKELAHQKGLEEEFRFYSKIETLAPKLIEQSRKIYKGVSVNIDFYSGFVYRMLNIPVELYTPIFAIARISGWSAHRIEELVNKGKIIRPAYKCIAPRKQYIPMDDRKAK